MFHAKIKFSYEKRFAFVFTGVELRKIGLKIAEVTYSTPELGLEKQKMTEIKSRFDFHIQIFKDFPNKEIDKDFQVTFHVKLTSLTPQFTHQLIDATWMEQLWTAACNRQLTDVEFLVGGKSFSAHRFILSARSSVFAAMFSEHNCMIETKTGKVEIVDTDPTDFENFLKFLYTGMLEPYSLADSFDLLFLAHKYDVQVLEQIGESLVAEVATESIVDLIMCS